MIAYYILHSITIISSIQCNLVLDKCYTHTQIPNTPHTPIHRISRQIQFNGSIDCNQSRWIEYIPVILSYRKNMIFEQKSYSNTLCTNQQQHHHQCALWCLFPGNCSHWSWCNLWWYIWKCMHTNASLSLCVNFTNPLVNHCECDFSMYRTIPRARVSPQNAHTLHTLRKSTDSLNTQYSIQRPTRLLLVA